MHSNRKLEMTEELFSLGYIDDGMELPGRIEASQLTNSNRRFWDTLEFTYRVAVPTEGKILDAKVAKFERDAFQSPELIVKAHEAKSAFIASHVKTWNLKNRGGHDVPLNAKSVMNLHEVLFDRLLDIVRGNSMSDPAPGEPEPMTHEEQALN